MYLETHRFFIKELLALMVCGAMGLSAVACGQTENTDALVEAYADAFEQVVMIP